MRCIKINLVGRIVIGWHHEQVRYLVILHDGAVLCYIRFIYNIFRFYQATVTLVSLILCSELWHPLSL